MSGIRFYREKAGLSQGQLAEAAGLSGQSVISNYENGIRTPGVAELIKIRDALRKKGVRVNLEKLAEDQQAA